MKHTLFLFVLEILCTFWSCKGEQGDPGPSGVADPVGTAAIQIHTLSLESSNWLPSVKERTAEAVNVSIITQDILDKGLVLAYLRTDDRLISDGTTWQALPFSISKTTGTYSFAYAVSPGTITIRESSAGSTSLDLNCDIRVVAVAGPGLMGWDAPVDWSNYAEVASYFRLE